MYYTAVFFCRLKRQKFNNQKGVYHMAYCTNCGGELFETSKFCPHCGTPVLEISSRPETEKPKEYDTENISNNSDGLPEVNTGVLTPEEQAAVLEMAAENILEDIPDIKKLEDESSQSDKAEPEKVPDEPKPPVKEEIHKEETAEKEALKPEEKKADISENISSPEKAVQPEIVNIPAEPKKKSGGGVIAVIAILAVAAVCGAVFFLGQNGEPVTNVVEQTELIITELTTTAETEIVSESEIISETAETEAPAATDEVTEAELASETEASAETASDTEVSAEEAVTESETASETASETELSEVSASEGIYSADDLAAGIVIEPEHQSAMGNSVSAEISLSEQGISPSILSSGVLFLAEFTSTAATPENITPAAMTITINGTPVNVTATSCSEGIVIFEYDLMTAAVEAAGFTAADIDSVAFRTTGVPIDVFRITILQG